MNVEEADPGEAGLAPNEAIRAERQKRRVSDDVLHAFHFACDTRDFEIASRLLAVLETILGAKRGQPDLAMRRGLAPLVAAHERLWALKQPLDQ